MDKVKNKVPKLRFSEFTDEWSLNKLGNLAIIIMGQSPDSKSYNNNGDGTYLIQGNADIINNISAPRQWTNEPTKICFNGDILLSVRAPVGTVAKSVHEACIGRGICALRNNERSSLDFIYQFLLYFEPKWRRIEQGSTFTAISSKDIASLKLFSPSLKEQQKIASFLTAVDDKIQQLTKKKELLEKYKKGVMQKIFSQEIRFKDDDGNDYPDWKVKNLGSLTRKVGKKNKDNLKLPIYSISNKHGFVPQGEQFEGMDSNERGYDISLYKIIGKHTFAYNPARINVGSIGYSGELDNVIVSSLYVCIKTSEELEDRYLEQYLTTYNFNKSVLRNTEGGVRQYLFYDNFSKIKIPLPSNEEQLKIADFLSSIDKKIDFVNTQLEKTKEFKKGLLQQMFV